MSISRIRNALSIGWIGIAMVFILLISTATLRADDKHKNKDKGNSTVHEKSGPPPAAHVNRTSLPASSQSSAGHTDRTTTKTHGDYPSANSRTNRSTTTTHTNETNSTTRTFHGPVTDRAITTTHTNQSTSTTRTFHGATNNTNQSSSTTHGAATTRTFHGPATTHTNQTTSATHSGQQISNTSAFRGSATASADKRKTRQVRSQTERAHYGEVTKHDNGKIKTYYGRNNTEAHFHADGRVSVVRAHGMTITHGTRGGRMVVMERPNRTVIVTHGVGYGYVQRPFSYRNHMFFQRTYYRNHATFFCYYRPYNYGRFSFNVYSPFRFYHPAFYGWAYSPWHVPVHYRWGWFGRPWYGYYGWYFAPYPVYHSPVLWLTDYLVAATLEAAYEERIAAAEAQAYAAASGGQVGLSPEVKQAIADEVQRQLELERDEAQNSGATETSQGLPPGLSDNKQHVFVVSRSLDVTSVNAGGQVCSLTEGDVIQLNGAPSSNSETVSVVVLASKGPDCPKGTVVEVALSDVIEMQNQMRATIDRGLEDLRTKQGQDGLPALPAEANRPPMQAAYASAAPPPDPNVANEINQQTQQADQVEKEVVNEASTSDSTAGTESTANQETSTTPANISIGQTIDEVVAILGQPLKKVDLGAKKIYVYKDMKITFIDGKVKDVQ